MAKSNTVQIKLVSTADTGYFYVTKKNARATTGKLEFKKYDPVARKHVAFQRGQNQVDCGFQQTATPPGGLVTLTRLTAMTLALAFALRQRPRHE